MVPGVWWEGDAALGPILVQDTTELEELIQLSDFPLEDPSLLQAMNTPPTGIGDVQKTW